MLAPVGLRASRPPHIGLSADFFTHQIVLPNNPRRPFAVLPRWQDALGDEAADGGGADGKDSGCVVDCHFAAVGSLTVTIDGDVVLMSK